MRSPAPRRYTVRLVVHCPPSSELKLASWSLMLVREGAGAPMGEVVASGNIPCHQVPPSYEDMLWMIDGIVGPQMIS